MARYQVVKDEEDSTYDGLCNENGCEFESQGWSKKKDASERMDAHIEEHDSEEPMPEMRVWLGEFEPDEVEEPA